jgi:pimeloyl-ACP methyl ester carboxylesterase
MRDKSKFSGPATPAGGTALLRVITFGMSLLFAWETPSFAQVPGGELMTPSMSGTFVTIISAIGGETNVTVTPSVCSPPAQTTLVMSVAEAEARLTPALNACVQYMNNQLRATPSGAACQFQPMVVGSWLDDGNPPPNSSGAGFGGEITSPSHESDLFGMTVCGTETTETVLEALVVASFQWWWCPPGLFPVVPFPQCSTSPQPQLGVALLDPIADTLASGSTLVSNTAQLASASHVVQGVAADSATQVLVRVESSSSAITPGDQIQLTLSDENGPSANGAASGYLTSLPANGPDSRLTGGVITVTAVDNGSGAAVAFAVYHAPTDFVRTGNVTDPTVKIRSVSVRVTDETTRATTTQTVSIVRPPVVLVHGLWGSPNDFDGADGGLFGLQDSRLFFLEYARYDGSIGISASDPAYPASDGTSSHPLSAKVSALGFKSGATTILPQLQNVIKAYKVVALLLAGAGSGSIAAVQADIVGHSMGGNVTRALPQLSQYAVQDTYNLGYVHKLITLDTPHLGAPLAAAFLSSSNSCVRRTLAFVNLYAFNSVTSNSGSFISGAAGDLATGSQALKATHSGTGMIPTAMIGAQLSTAQLNKTGSSGEGQAISFFCGFVLSNPLALSLSPLAWPTVAGDPSDGIVPLSSQFDGDLSYSNATNGFLAVHSKGARDLGFGGATILDQASLAPAEVINLLNTPVSNSTIFEEKP